MTTPTPTPNIAPHHHATIQELTGQDVVLSYTGVNAEYDALRSSAIVVDRSHRGRLRFIGEKAGEALTGLVTNDVLSLAPEHGQYGAALTSKGRIVADLRIFAHAGSYFVDTSARAWPGWLAMVRKYVNPRVTGYRDESHAIRDIGVFGPQAEHIVAARPRSSGTSSPPSPVSTSRRSDNCNRTRTSHAPAVNRRSPSRGRSISATTDSTSSCRSRSLNRSGRTSLRLVLPQPD